MIFTLTTRSETLQLIPKFEDHRLRRSVLAPFFSRHSVLRLEWLIKENINRLCLRLEEHRDGQSPANMPLLYRCLSTDIISEYCFSQCYRFLDDPERSETFFEAYRFGFKHFFLFREVPFVSKFMHSPARLIPEWMVPWLRGAFVLEMISWARVIYAFFTAPSPADPLSERTKDDSRHHRQPSAHFRLP